MPPPGWSQPEQVVDGVFSPTSRELQQSMSNPTPVAGMDLTSNLFLKDLGATHHIGAPIHVYPLFENGFRAHRGQSIQENNQESADLYAEFATTAEQNPVAWSYGKPAETAMSIGTVSKRNRMICFPCKSSYAPRGYHSRVRSAFNECIQHGQSCWCLSVDFG
jgi:hypothetical protein